MMEEKKLHCIETNELPRNASNGSELNTIRSTIHEMG